MTTTQTVDTARIALLLNELRLPAIKIVWSRFAEQADKEGWPAARFLTTIAEHELAERGRRRIERHLAEARLPPGKTLDTFDFDAVPMISKAQVTAITAPVRPARRRQEPSGVRHRSRPDREWMACAVRPHHRSRPEAPSRTA